MFLHWGILNANWACLTQGPGTPKIPCFVVFMFKIEQGGLITHLTHELCLAVLQQRIWKWNCVWQRRWIPSLREFQDPQAEGLRQFVSNKRPAFPPSASAPLCQRDRPRGSKVEALNAAKKKALIEHSYASMQCIACCLVPSSVIYVTHYTHALLATYISVSRIAPWLRVRQPDIITKKNAGTAVDLCLSLGSCTYSDWLFVLHLCA